MGPASTWHLLGRRCARSPSGASPASRAASRLRVPRCRVDPVPLITRAATRLLLRGPSRFFLGTVRARAAYLEKRAVWCQKVEALRALERESHSRNDRAGRTVPQPSPRQRFHPGGGVRGKEPDPPPHPGLGPGRAREAGGRARRRPPAPARLPRPPRMLPSRGPTRTLFSWPVFSPCHCRAHPLLAGQASCPVLAEPPPRWPLRGSPMPALTSSVGASRSAWSQFLSSSGCSPSGAPSPFALLALLPSLFKQTHQPSRNGPRPGGVPGVIQDPTRVRGASAFGSFSFRVGPGRLPCAAFGSPASLMSLQGPVGTLGPPRGPGGSP